MNGARGAGATAAAPQAGAPARTLPWPGALAWTLAATLGTILALYHATFRAMIELWTRSPTFAHGFAIVPISLWLVWRQRRALAAVVPRPAAAGFALLLLLGLAWLLAYAAHVQVVAQYAATAMLPTAVIAVLGWRGAGAIAFPLAYLLLAVPFGEVFLAPLIDFTARFTVGALQLTGVPVFRENNNFSIPSGNWSVVEACSGLRYVIASLALGTLYAYLNYRSLGRRLLFILVALLLPILANGLRAYMIVMLGHWSDMRLAVGVDHLLYGWVFFGLVSLLLFWVGAFWREERQPLATAAPDAPAGFGSPGAPPGALRALGAAAGCCVALAACWPLLAAATLDRGATAARATAARLEPETPAGWRAAPAKPGDWRARHAGAPLRHAGAYAAAPYPAGISGSGAGKASLQLVWYPTQSKDSELLARPPAGPDDAWLTIDERGRTVQAGGRRLHVRQTILQSGAGRLLVWRWYRQSGVDTDKPVLVKLLLAKARLLGAPQDGLEIIVSAPYEEPAPAPAPLLGNFLTAMLPSIERALRDAGRP